jgi:DNA-binding NarL/FixJ family response regulator
MQPTPVTTSPTRIVLADDHDLVRSGIKGLLDQIDSVSVVGEARDGNELIAAVDRLLPDIVMTDISMPGMDGLVAIARIHEKHPAVRLIVISTHDTADIMKRAVAGGACGYLTKDASPSELELAVRSVMAGGNYFGSKVSRSLLNPTPLDIGDELTERQTEILSLLAGGLASKEIGFQLGISPKTVDVHRARIMDRLGLHDVSSLTRYAIRKKLIAP